MSTKLGIKNLPTEKERIRSKTVSWSDNRMKNLSILEKNEKRKTKSFRGD